MPRLGGRPVRPMAPVRPQRLFQVGLNYRSHLAEIGRPAPEQPLVGVADPTVAIADPGAVITRPAEAPDQLDYECEIRGRDWSGGARRQRPGCVGRGRGRHGVQ